MNEQRSKYAQVRTMAGPALVATVLALAGLTVVISWRYAPPEARPASAPETSFSAARAIDALRRALGPQDPHPAGSAANAAVRQRLLAELGRMGLQPTLETGVGCLQTRCATVSNVLARIPGRDPRAPAVLLAVHYDSVPAGPGAGDDGAGVATLLEVARALRAGASPPRDVLLLVDEGEELGLLGARSFVKDAGRLGRISAVVNLEARGSSGPVSLFELSPGNGRLVAAMARHLPRPVTSSIFYFLYQRLPNDTDLTVFKKAGLAGVNLAFVGSPLRYHTPRDDVAHLDAGSVQQMGDQALAMVRALAEGSQWHARGDSVFFDVLALGIVRWPERWSIALALLALFLVVLATRLGRRRRAGDHRALLAGSLVLAAALVAVGLGAALGALLRGTGALPYVWIAHLAPLRLAFWAAGGLAVAALGALAATRLTAAGAWVGVWGAWSVLALVAAIAAPAIAFPLLVPALLAGVCGAAVARRGAPPGAWASLPPVLAALALAGPLAWVLPEAMGAPGLPAVALLVALVLTGTLPALVAAGRGTSGLLAAVAAVCLVGGVVAAYALPRFTADDPQPVSLVLVDDADAAATRWTVPAAGPALPAELARVGAFAPQPAVAYPWPARDAWVAPGPKTRLVPPELVVESAAVQSGDLHVVARLRSLRGAPVGQLRLPADRLAAARLAGEPLEIPPAEGGNAPAGLVMLEFGTLPPEGVRVELTLHGAQPVAVHVSDVAFGLAGAGDDLRRARPDSAVPIGFGDRSLATHLVTLGPPPPG